MTADLERGFSLGNWRIYPRRNLLEGPSGEVQIEPKVMQVLERLAASRGDVVERNTLLRDVWGNRAMSDEPLTRCIATLRRVLDDSPSDPRYIQTIPKRGYRLVCPVQPLQSESALTEFHDSAMSRVRVPVAIAVVSAAILAIVLVYFFVSNEPATMPQVTVDGTLTSKAPMRSIAVLPFANLSPDPENEYLSDGLASELLNQLTRIPDLKVAARTSAFSFKGEDRDVTEIARKLRVAHLLTGSVRQSGGKLRISAQLVDGSDGYHIWSETWEQEFTDVFEIQDAIAESVAVSLRIEFLDQDLSVERTEPEAYALYLEAREMAREPVTGLDPTIQFQPRISKLLQVIAIDPDYAPAWSAMAGIQVSMAQWIRDWDPDPTFSSARASAERALALDPDDVRALRVLAYIDMLRNWDFVSAARWLAKALAAAPQDPATLRAIEFLYSRLRPGEKPEFIPEAWERDPLNAGALLNDVFQSLKRGDFEEARVRLAEARQLAPDAIRVQSAEGLIEYLEGDYEAAAQKAGGDSLTRLCALYRLGQVDRADREFDELLDAAALPARDVAAAYACRGDTEKAFDSLYRALEVRENGLEIVRGYWFFDALHDDPRWQRLLEAVGVADEHADQVDRIFEAALKNH